MIRIAACIAVPFLYAISFAALAWQNAPTPYGDPLRFGPYVKDLRQLIMAGAKRNRWQVVNEQPGRIALRIESDGLQVDVDAVYDSTTLRLVSDGPKASSRCATSSGCEITTQSRFWLVKLRRSIALEIHALAIADAGGKIEGEFIGPDLERFRTAISSNDPKAINSATAKIASGEIYERYFLDIAANRIWQLRTTNDPALADAAAKLARAIAEADGPRYRNLIASVAATATRADLRSSAASTLALVELDDEVEQFAPP